MNIGKTNKNLPNYGQSSHNNANAVFVRIMSNCDGYFSQYNPNWPADCLIGILLSLCWITASRSIVKVLSLQQTIRIASGNGSVTVTTIATDSEI